MARIYDEQDDMSSQNNVEKDDPPIHSADTPHVTKLHWPVPLSTVLSPFFSMPRPQTRFSYSSTRHPITPQPCSGDLSTFSTGLSWVSCTPDLVFTFLCVLCPYPLVQILHLDGPVHQCVQLTIRGQSNQEGKSRVKSQRPRRNRSAAISGA